jgi:hypothetical protein
MFIPTIGLVELLKVLLCMCTNLHNCASLHHIGDELPLLLVRLQALKEQVVLFLGPSSS